MFKAIIEASVRFRWFIVLVTLMVSAVEASFLSAAEKLRLHGRLEAEWSRWEAENEAVRRWRLGALCAVGFAAAAVVCAAWARRRAA